MNRKQSSILILSIIALGITAFYAYSMWHKNAFNVKSTSNKPTPTITDLTPKYVGSYELITKIDPQSRCNDTTKYSSHCLTDFYLKDLNTNTTKLIFSNGNVANGVLPGPTYKSGYIFYLKRTGNDTYPSKDWADELWVVTDQDHGQKLYSGQGFDYSIRPDGLVAAVFPSTSGSDFSIKVISTPSGKQTDTINLNSAELKKYDPDISDHQVNLVDWSPSGDKLWGDSGFAGDQSCFWNYDFNSKQFSYHPVSNNVGELREINFENMTAVYIDAPHFFDVDSYKEWVAKNPTISLFLYHIDTQQSTKIDTISSKEGYDFTGWTSPNVFSYKVAGVAKTYTIN